MPAELKVSNSRIKLFHRCKRAHYYKYYMKLVRKTKGEALIRGSVIHEALEAYHKGKSWKKVVKNFEKDFYKNTFEEERAELGNLPAMITEILENYFICYADDDDKWEHVEQELHFMIPLPGTAGKIELEGYVDDILKDNKSLIWLGETKTHKRIPSQDFRLTNVQTASYVWALRELGLYKKIRGILWNYIIAKEPTKPKLLKSGELSKAKIDTTPHTYIKALKELGKNPKDYQDIISQLDYSSYFIRYPMVISESMIKSTMEDMIETSKQIYNCGPELKARNLTNDCDWCDYKILCQSDLMNLDTEYLIKNEFEVREGGRPKEKVEGGKTIGKEKSSKRK
jgi:hypothetical protein